MGILDPGAAPVYAVIVELLVASVETIAEVATIEEAVPEDKATEPEDTAAVPEDAATVEMTVLAVASTELEATTSLAPAIDTLDVVMTVTTLLVEAAAAPVLVATGKVTTPVPTETATVVVIAVMPEPVVTARGVEEEPLTVVVIVLADARIVVVPLMVKVAPAGYVAVTAPAV